MNSDYIESQKYCSSIRIIKGVGEARAKAFAGLGVRTLADLLCFFPRTYEDRSVFVPIDATVDGQEVCISAVVAEQPRLSRIRRGMDLVKFRVVDETGSVDVTYFNQSWMKDNVQVGEEYVLFGKIQVEGRHRSLSNPVLEKTGQKGNITGRIVPVYRLCKGLTQKTVMQSVRAALDDCGGSPLLEFMPKEILERQSLCSTAFAFENIHFPSDYTALEKARRRLIFEELFLLSCALGSSRSSRTLHRGISFKRPDLPEFLNTLPFTPTVAQMRALSDALDDMSSGKQMNRLVQGDVGSGKTLVAAALIWAAFRNGYSSVFMAPTELLAEQHTATMEKFLAPFGIPVVRLTGSMKAAEKRSVKEQLAGESPCLAVGTHALFSAGVEYRKLGLIITDEQHRFGVEQRAALIAKGSDPHVLVMSATPIPRTLALMIYGDLDVSVIDEMPPGRQKVDTFVVDSSYRARMNGFIRKQVTEGHQVFIVCPMVEETERPEQQLQQAEMQRIETQQTGWGSSLKSAEAYSRELQSLLPELRIGCVHGKMKADSKESVMTEFSMGNLDVLVSTTVIEVGVDVPNATLMIIENADRFGLSQLHQLRGRVGRGKSKSWCILVSDATGEDAKKRLHILCKTNDGFKISEEDLRLRGPGDFFGSRQHGLPEMHLADLGADTGSLLKAQEEANRLLREDPDLVRPEHAHLKERVSRLILDSSTFN